MQLLYLASLLTTTQPNERVIALSVAPVTVAAAGEARQIAPVQKAKEQKPKEQRPAATQAEGETGETVSPSDSRVSTGEVETAESPTTKTDRPPAEGSAPGSSVESTSAGRSSSASAGVSTPSSAGAQGSVAANSPSISGSAAGPAATAIDRAPPATATRPEPWLVRHRPRARQWELGAFLGVFLPSRSLELMDPDLPVQHLERAAADLGLRAGYYPLAHFGIEGEFAFIPTKTLLGVSSLVYSARAQAILQLGLFSVTPFVVAGGGALGVRSSSLGVGSNVDESFHLGGGIKVYATRRIAVRVEARDVMSPSIGIGNTRPAHSPEILAGITVRLGPRPLKAAADADPDKDGIAGSTDKCPEQAGPAPDGCPKTDSDGDGVADVCDRCPDKPSPAPDGCPVTDRGQDLDGDGVSGAADRCPREAGPAPDGCPLADPDGDGIAGAEDRCPDQAETFNAFEDRDGCPDEIPPELETLNIEGQKIAFGVNTAELDQGSRGILDAVADSLRQFSETRIEISGHTDNRGSADYNLELSRKRADAVVNYLVGRGIDRGRLVTRGAGADEPVADNRSERGRAANRRIEFRLLPEP